MKPVLNAPGSPLLKLSYDGLLSNLAFNFNLRHYSLAGLLTAGDFTNKDVYLAGAYTRPSFSST
jgi:hypothetical protein